MANCLDNLTDYLAAHLGEPLAPPLVEEAERILIEPKLVQDGSVHIAQVKGIFDRTQADVIFQRGCRTVCVLAADLA